MATLPSTRAGPSTRGRGRGSTSGRGSPTQGITRSNARRGGRGSTINKLIADHQKLSSYGFSREVTRRETPLNEDKWTSAGDDVEQGVEEGDKARERGPEGRNGKPEGLAKAGTELGTQVKQIMGISAFNPTKTIKISSLPKGIKSRTTDQVYRDDRKSTQLEGRRHQTPIAINTEEESSNPVTKAKSEGQESDKLI